MKINNIKRKHIIIIAIITLCVGGVAISQIAGGISAETISNMIFPELKEIQEAYMDDDYWRSCNDENWVGIELIPNNLDTNLSVVISIHRNYGIPRFGIPTDNNGNVLDTVWYIPNNCKGLGSVRNCSDYTDTSITIYWCETQFRILIMDILTGDTVHQETHNGQPASMFEDATNSFQFYDSLDASGNLSKPGTLYTTSDDSHPFKTEDNLGTTIYYGNLPKGSYFVVTIRC